MTSAGSHLPEHADRMSKYAEHIGKYEFYSLSFPIPLSSVGSFATANSMSINVYGVDDDKEVIYPLRVSSTPVPDIHVDLFLFEHGGVQHYTTITTFCRLARSQLSNHRHATYCSPLEALLAALLNCLKT